MVVLRLLVRCDDREKLRGFELKTDFRRSAILCFNSFDVDQ